MRFFIVRISSTVINLRWLTKQIDCKLLISSDLLIKIRNKQSIDPPDLN